MPFDASMEDVFYYGIQQPVHLWVFSVNGLINSRSLAP